MAAQREMTVLIVDDEVEICDITEFHIKEMTNYRVLKAYRSGDALEMVRKGGIDVVVSDVRMPGGDGMELLDDIGALDASCRPHVIIMSGLSGEGREGDSETREGDVADELLEFLTNEITQDEVQAKGGYTYLPKPMNMDDLIETLKKLLG